MENLFPQLRNDGYKVTSPAAIGYNCIAWAAEDTNACWWPDPYDLYYWPPGIPREDNIDAFVKAYESLGYTICPDQEYEPGYNKIAIYATPNGKPTHASRQLDSGRWTSKVGKLEDIEHGFDGLSGHTYGSVVVIMKRCK